MSFRKLVEDELAGAMRQYPPMNSLHEGYAVILEEVEELWEEVRHKQIPELGPDNRDVESLKSQRNQAAIVMELVQIAAMCERLYLDVASDGNKVHK